jgi:hypothetical protein
MEIEKILQRYGANGFAYGWQVNTATIMFEMSGRRVRFNLPMPDPQSKEVTLDRYGRRKSAELQKLTVEKLSRQKWRAMALVVKAKLEAVESQIVTFEEEFMAHIVLPNGATVGQWMQPQIESAYRGGKMPPMLGEGKGP